MIYLRENDYEKLFMFSASWSARFGIAPVWTQLITPEALARLIQLHLPPPKLCNFPWLSMIKMFVVHVLDSASRSAIYFKHGQAARFNIRTKNSPRPTKVNCLPARNRRTPLERVLGMLPEVIVYSQRSHADEELRRAERKGKN